MHPVRILTYFGNAAVLIPLCLVLALWMARYVSRHIAVWWLVCVGSVVSVTAFAKIWFAGCGYTLWHIHSPSGHTSFSSIAYCGLAMVLAAGRPEPRRHQIRLFAVLWIIGIGLTRIRLQAHTPQEVLAGWIVGGLGAIVFARVYGTSQRPDMRWIIPIGAALFVVALLPQAHFSFESLLDRMGRQAAGHLPICIIPAMSE